MPPEPLREIPMARAAFWLDQALALVPHIFVDIFLHLIDRILLHSVQVAYVLLLLVAGKIF